MNTLKRKRIRLQNYDYSQYGRYFVTVCTHERFESLGGIKNGQMILSEMGQVAQQCWQDIPKHFPGVSLDQYAIMPNHIHGIIIVGLGAADLRPLHADRTKMTLSKIIHAFKSSTTRQIHQRIPGMLFRWQRSFYDHIIRNDTALNNVRHYISCNMKNWETDRNNIKILDLAYEEAVQDLKGRADQRRVY